jgi:hypothetical protein
MFIPLLLIFVVENRHALMDAPAYCGFLVHIQNLQVHHVHYIMRRIKTESVKHNVRTKKPNFAGLDCSRDQLENQKGCLHCQ